MNWNAFTEPEFSILLTLGLMIVMVVCGYAWGAKKERIRAIILQATLFTDIRNTLPADTDQETLTRIKEIIDTAATLPRDADEAKEVLETVLKQKQRNEIKR
jgi:hypothetical protein